MSPLDYILAAAIAGVLVPLITQMFWLHASNSERDNLRDRHDDDLKTIADLTKARDGFSSSVDMLKPALATSDNLLAAANTRITELLAKVAALEKANIDAAPLADLVAESHGSVLSPTGAAAPTATGDDHHPAQALPDPGPASGR